MDEKKPFQIIGTIDPKDIPPPVRKLVVSKYEPIIKAVSTLEKAEGIEISVQRASQSAHLQKLLRRRMPHQRFQVTTRTTPKGVRLYIVKM